MILVAKGQQYWAYKPPEIVEIFQSCPPSNVSRSGAAKKTVGLGVLRTVAWYIIGVSRFSCSIVTSTNHTSRLDPSLLPFFRGKSSRIVTAAVLLAKYHSAKNRKKSVEGRIYFSTTTFVSKVPRIWSYGFALEGNRWCHVYFFLLPGSVLADEDRIPV